MSNINNKNTLNLSKAFAERRSHTYPAHKWLAEKFPEYVKIMLDLDYEIRQKTKIYDEKMHELFHIIALAVKGSNPHNQQHLKAHIKKGLKLGLDPEEIAEALMVCVNPGGAMVLTYSVTCMLEAIEELRGEGWKEPS
ncbi:MAG: carboxymuconolactone decarboxylase family protein [Hyphomicrobiales bacterium]|jgi:alkylhydroperoxidase/carboxymuconolactone decarboxylase family protein YurZ|nr:carboxymuconolactone decarboxylase family protein [Hyphomicrobiales bacterium]|tara:strand:- start:1473 stop:1886 length:414 start_codon:yes stop_codon:yes gene_type:complete